VYGGIILRLLYCCDRVEVKSRHFSPSTSGSSLYFMYTLSPLVFSPLTYSTVSEADTATQFSQPSCPSAALSCSTSNHTAAPRYAMLFKLSPILLPADVTGNLSRRCFIHMHHRPQRSWQVQFDGCHFVRSRNQVEPASFSPAERPHLPGKEGLTGSRRRGNGC
jgi:hypothetical protein